MGNRLTAMAPPPPFLPGPPRLHLVLVGLDAAGKTALLYRLKLAEFVEPAPTRGFNAETVRLPLGGARRQVRLQLWDVGGAEKLRPLWRSFTRRTDGLVFVVDAGAPERLEEARAELHRISRTAGNRGVPVLIAATKQDRAAALSPAQLEKALALPELGGATPTHVIGCSALDGRGLQAGLEELYGMILRRRKELRSSRGKELRSSTVTGR